MEEVICRLLHFPTCDLLDPVYLSHQNFLKAKSTAMREQLKNSLQIWSNECGHSYTENDEINGIARATHVSRCDPKNVNTRTQKMMFSYQHV